MNGFDQQTMQQLLIEWVNINTFSDNLSGLSIMEESLVAHFSKLGGTIQQIALPSRSYIDSQGQTKHKSQGNLMLIQKHPEAKIKVLLGGHYDTVFSPDCNFQKATLIDENTLKGPGATDMKGGLVILLKALEALEASPEAGKIGWEVFINPNEEVGSIGVDPILIECAKRNAIGLLFEPSFADGAMVTERKGSANFTLIARGKAAHAGRDFHSGRNAISALAQCIVEIEKLNKPNQGLTINIGHIEGGGPINIVPDLAICRINVRMQHPGELEALKGHFKVLLKKEEKEGISLNLFENYSRLPKNFDQRHHNLFNALNACSEKPLLGRPSGGVCDGNILSAAGLPTLDTLGAIGGNIHTEDEYVLLDSLPKRAHLTSTFLRKLANGKISLQEIL